MNWLHTFLQFLHIVVQIVSVSLSSRMALYSKVRFIMYCFFLFFFPGILCCITGCLVPSVLRQYSGFILKGQNIQEGFSAQVDA